MLGIHPGFGGTVRAVRRAGVRTAMEMMLTGKTLRADKAKSAGFLDRLVYPADAEAAARELINRQPKQRRPRLLDRVLSWPLVRGLVKKQLTAQVRAKARPEHYPAPYAIIDLWSRHGAHGASAYEAEARSIAELMLERYVSQSGTGFPAPGPAQESRRQDPRAPGARARRGCGRHGWRHRRLVCTARTQRDAAGSRAQVHRARPHARARGIRKAAQGQRQGRGAHDPPDRGRCR